MSTEARIQEAEERERALADAEAAEQWCDCSPDLDILDVLLVSRARVAMDAARERLEGRWGDQAVVALLLRALSKELDTVTEVESTVSERKLIAQLLHEEQDMIASNNRFVTSGASEKPA